MAKHIYDKPVTLQHYDEATEEYIDVEGIPGLHAHINTAYFSTEKYAGKAMQDDAAMDFYFRYFPLLLEVVKKPQLYRIVWGEDAYDIVGGDDYQMSHSEIRLRGVIVNGGR